MRTPSLLGIALLCLSAMAAAMDDGSVSMDIQQNYTSNIQKLCQSYDGWDGVGPYCVKYFKTQHSFAEAEFACRKKISEGHLISLHDEQTNIDLLKIVKNSESSPSRIWLGGMKLFKSKEFIWTDGSVWNYQNWVPGQPDNTSNTEDCVEMNWKKEGEWNDNNCEEKKNFICSFKSGGRV